MSKSPCDRASQLGHFPKFNPLDMKNLIHINAYIYNRILGDPTTSYKPLMRACQLVHFHTHSTVYPTIFYRHKTKRVS